MNSGLSGASMAFVLVTARNFIINSALFLKTIIFALSLKVPKDFNILDLGIPREVGYA